MFGGLGNLASLIKQAKGLQENMQKIQEEMAARRYEGEAGAGWVRAVVNGKKELLELKIDPQAVTDLELLQELIKSALSAAGRKAEEALKTEMSQLAGGLNLPGLGDLLGQGT